MTNHKLKLTSHGKNWEFDFKKNLKQPSDIKVVLAGMNDAKAKSVMDSMKVSTLHLLILIDYNVSFE